MKIRLSQLKKTIALYVLKETIAVAPQITIDTLAHVLDKLDDMLESGILTLPEYEREWNDTLRSVGWTKEMYEKEIDRRWDYIDQTRDVPIHGKEYIN